MGKNHNEALSSHDTKIKPVDRNEKADNKGEMETESEHSKKKCVSVSSGKPIHCTCNLKSCKDQHLFLLGLRLSVHM